MNFVPNRPEAEIMQEYLDAWDYLYEPSRYLARSYRYYLAMRPIRRDKAMATGGPPSRENVPDRGINWRRKWGELGAVFKILWRHGVLPPYRRQFWAQLIGMWRQNPTRLEQYFSTCAMGEDLFNLRRVVREKATAIIQERQLEIPGMPSLGGAALQGIAAAPLEPLSSRASRD
jgi:hypothetical protein